MIRFPSICVLAALLCAVLFFSCSPTLEPPPPPPNQQVSSSDTEQPPLSQPSDRPSSSSQQPPTSSPAQSSSSAPNSSSSSQQPPTSSPAQSSSSPTQTAVGCKESDPKAGFTCSWDGYTAGSILTPGKKLKPDYNGLPSGCSSIEWKFAPDNTAIALNYECQVLPSDGLTAEGSRNYVLFAELTCEDGKHTNACEPTDGLPSKRAPALSGTCTWSKNPTTSARGAVPSGVTVVDADKICATTNVVYKYADGEKTWPANGLVEAGTYSDVKATVNCPGYNVPPASCPILEVKGGTDHLIECTCSNGNNCDLSPTFCKTDGVKGYEVTLKNDECVEISVFYTNQYLTGSKVVMRCSTDMGAQQSLKGTLSLNGKVIQSFTGSYNWSGTIEIGKINLYENEFGTLCLTNLSGATSVKCTGPSF